MKRTLLIALAGLGLVFAACGGESDQDKAKSDVCDARADIEKNVKELQGLTIGTATVDQVKSNLTAIRDDFVKIGDARANLDSARKQEVEKANQAFKSDLQKLVDGLGTSTSLNAAAAQLKTGIANLASAYQDSLGSIDCG